MATTQGLLPDLKRVFGSEDDQVPRTLESFAKGELEPEATAQKIATIYEATLRQGNDKPIGGLWNALAMLSRHCSHERTGAARMVAFLNSLSEQGDIMQATTASTQSVSAEDLMFWRDLPGFSWAFRQQAFELDAHRFLRGKQSLLDTTTFAATYLQQAKPRIRQGMGFIAEVGLMLGLEHNQGELTALYLPAAATWMAIAAQRIRELCTEEYRRDDSAPGLPEAYHGPPLWTSGRGFSVPRWNFWKQRLATLAQSNELSTELSSQAREAHDAMLRVDQ